MKVNRSKLAEIFGVALSTVDAWRRKGCPHEKEGNAIILDTQKVFTWYTDGEELDLNKERAKLAKKQREKLTLEIAEKEGHVVSIDQVVDVQTSMISACKTRLLAIPNKAAAAVLSAGSLPEIQDILNAEIKEALEELKEYFRKGEDEKKKTKEIQKTN